MTYYKCGSIHPTQNSNVVVDTASGAIANFETPLAMPLPKARFDFKATQEAGTPTPQSPKAISGVNAVNVFHCHKNFFDLNYLTASGIIIQNGEAIGTAQAFYDNFGTNTEGLKQFKFKPNTAYTLSLKAYTNGSYATSGQGIYFRINYTDGTYASLVINNNQQNYGEFARTTSSNKTIDKIYIVYSSGYSNTWHLKDIQIEEGASASEFETYNGSTTLINLGGTYYGGYVTQDKNGKRELTVTKGVTTLGELTNWIYAQGSGVWRFQAKMPNDYKKPETISERLDFVCSCFTPDLSPTTGGSVDNSIAGYTNDTKIYILCNSYTDLETFLTALSSQMLVYPLAEPFTVALPDGDPIKSFAGVNNIFCDTGDTSLQFHKIG